MPPEAHVVKADPTKDFFISMIVRDISLVPAIVDLVDNSVDGARRLRPLGGGSEGSEGSRFAGLWINVRTSAGGFEISDNCGGIPWPIARDYAFRFGRPEDAPQTPDSIGQFGIGMKRALFKLGEAFTVESKTLDETFTLSVDVDEWRQSADWVFDQVEYESIATEIDECGTNIRVRPLHVSVAETFGETRFRNRLGVELARAHQATVSSGLAITLNNVPINVDIQSLLLSDELQPARVEQILDDSSDKPIHVEIIVGLSDSKPSDAGWYIYCNGRLILGPDRSELTGWGEGKGKTLPQYHNQFSRFRGYLFFESSDVTKLPWTTTKDGIDSDHSTYRSVRPKMLELARQVIDFLNALDSEKDHPVKGAASLEGLVAAAEKNGPRAISTLPVSGKFVSPARKQAPARPNTQSIQYVRPLAQIQALKKVLKASSAREVGELTFDYFYRREVDDSE